MLYLLFCFVFILLNFFLCIYMQVLSSVKHRTYYNIMFYLFSVWGFFIVSLFHSQFFFFLLLIGFVFYLLWFIRGVFVYILYIRIHTFFFFIMFIFMYFFIVFNYLFFLCMLYHLWRTMLNQKTNSALFLKTWFKEWCRAVCLVLVALCRTPLAAE